MSPASLFLCLATVVAIGFFQDHRVLANEIEFDANDVEDSSLARKERSIDFHGEALRLHNKLRRKHGVPDLMLDTKLNKMAQKWANYLAESGKWGHSNTKGVGENIASMSGISSLLNVTIATMDWYNEIDLYDFDNPGHKKAAGHFTQIVWKNSKKLGVGVAINKKARRSIYVANYSPPGNYVGRKGKWFKENVFRPISV